MGDLYNTSSWMQSELGAQNSMKIKLKMGGVEFFLIGDHS